MKEFVLYGVNFIIGAFIGYAIISAIVPETYSITDKAKNDCIKYGVAKKENLPSKCYSFYNLE